MRACQNAYEASAECALGDLPGVEIQHDLFLSLPDLTAWSAIAARLTDVRAEVRALQIAPDGDGLGLRCRLTRIASDQVRALVADLLKTGVARRGQVEHLLLAAGAAR